MFPTLLMRAAFSTLEAGQASLVTINHRLPMLASLSLWPTAATALEAQRMVTEKVAAAIEGSMAASQEATDLMMRAALGRADMTDMAKGMLTIAAAASRPARKRVKANAKRLSRRKR